MKYKIGQTASVTKIFSEKDVILFAQLSGDLNPLHLDSEYAKRSIFKKPIIHGMLVVSLISNVIANKLPGPGSIYMGQTLKFIGPAFHNDVLTAKITVIEIVEERNHLILSTEVFNQNAILLIFGQARIKVL